MTSSEGQRFLWTGPREDSRRYKVDNGADGPVTVGDGGEGLVYRSVGDSDGATHDVALKMLTSLALDDYERVAERSRVMTQILHPHIMRQLETFVGTALIDSDDLVDDDFGVIYTVAEWVPGEPLSEAVQRQGPKCGLAWVAQIARAVAHLHAHRGSDAPNGIVHRDIKPSNVRITPEGQAVLLDFGIARPLDGTDLTVGAGTCYWRAPEAIVGPAVLASDAWGVGALAYWVLTGECPSLEGASVARERLVQAAREQGFRDPIRLSRHIAALLESAPAARPKDLSHWADQLEAASKGTLRRERIRRPLVFAIPGVLLLAVLGIVLGSDSSSARSATSSQYAFSPEVYPSGLLVTRIWTLSGEGGVNLHEVLRLADEGRSKLSGSFDDVIPIQVARSATDITFVPRPSEIVESDPVVSYSLAGLTPGAAFSTTFEATLPSSSTPLGERLRNLVADQVRAQADFDALKGKSAAAPITLIRLRVSPSSIRLFVGESDTILVTGVMSNGSTAGNGVLSGLAWTSSNSKVAKVSAGIVLAVGVGKATIAVQAGGVTQRVSVTVITKEYTALAGTSTSLPVTSTTAESATSTTAPRSSTVPSTAVTTPGTTTTVASTTTTTSPSGPPPSISTGTAGSTELTLRSDADWYTYIGANSGGNPITDVSWSEDLGVIASYSGNLCIDIGRSPSSAGEFSSVGTTNVAIAGAAVTGYKVTALYRAHISQSGASDSGPDLSLPFSVPSGDSVLLAIGGEGAGDVELTGVSADQLQNSTYSEAGSNVIASAALYKLSAGAGSYTATWSSTTYPTNSGASLGAVAYILQPS